MSATAETVSQEAPPAEEFLQFRQAWKDGVQLAGPSLFGCQCGQPEHAQHWRQLTPKLDVIRKSLPNKSQAEATFAAAMASFFNAEEGQKLLKKAGCEAFGGLANILPPRQRSIIACLFLNFHGW